VSNRGCQWATNPLRRDVVDFKRRAMVALYLAFEWRRDVFSVKRRGSGEQCLFVLSAQYSMLIEHDDTYCVFFCDQPRRIVVVKVWRKKEVVVPYPRGEISTAVSTKFAIVDAKLMPSF